MQASSWVARLNAFHGPFPLYVWLEIGAFAVTAIVVPICLAVLDAIVGDDDDHRKSD